MENNIFETNPIPKTYMKMALPIVLGMMISVVYNIVDTFFIAQTNNINLVAGVSLGAPIFMILMAFGNILGQGGTSLISRLIGKQDKENVNSVSSFCFYFAIVIGVIISALMIVFQKQFLTLLGATEETYQYAWEYYIVLAVGAPISVLTFIHMNLIRAEGLAAESMFGSVAGTIVNIILDPILISVMNLGALGAAIATVIGYGVSDVILAIIVLKKSKYLSINPAKAKIPMEYITQIFGIGIPAALANIMSSICTILTNQFLLPYGNDKIATMGIVLKVSMMGMLMITGFAFGGAPIIGYFFGSKNKEKLHELFNYCYRFIIVLAISISAILFVCAPWLIRAFLSDAALITVGTMMFRVQVVCLPFMAITLMSQIFCQSFGKMLGSFILSLSRQGFVFIIVIYIASMVAGYYGIVYTQLVADVISMAIAVVIIKTIVLPGINCEE